MYALSTQAKKLLDKWVEDDSWNRNYNCAYDPAIDSDVITLIWTYEVTDLNYSHDLTATLRIKDVVNDIARQDAKDGKQRLKNPAELIDKLVSVRLELHLKLLKIKIDSADRIVKECKRMLEPLIDIEEKLKPLSELNKALMPLNILQGKRNEPSISFKATISEVQEVIRERLDEHFTG